MIIFFLYFKNIFLDIINIKFILDNKNYNSIFDYKKINYNI